MAKILIISATDDLPCDESDELWMQAVKILAQKHRVACSTVVGSELDPQIRALEAAGAKIIPRRRTLSQAARLANWFVPQAFQRVPPDPIEEAIRTFNPDLVLISQSGNTDGLVSMRICKKYDVPYANVIQTVPEGVSWPADPEVERQRPLYQDSKCLCFVAERNHKFLETQFSARFPNHAIVRNPFNVAYDNTVAWPNSEKPLRLACVARLELYAKGQDMLFDLLSLPKWRERAVTIDLFGCGPNEWIIREQIKRLNLTNLVVRGHVDDIASIWADHHALILPSRQEGLPLALVEAFLCGRPAVVTRVGGNAELVEEGVNGFVAPAPTVELVDQALERLWESRARLNEMGAAARKTAEQKIPPKPVEAFVARLTELLPKN